jgi:hypothetical protein
MKNEIKKDPRRRVGRFRLHNIYHFYDNEKQGESFNFQIYF